MVQGTAAEVIAHSQLSTYVISARKPGMERALAMLGRELRDREGVETTIPFGTTLHVLGHDAAALARALEPLAQRPDFDIVQTAPSLEDVFISLMGQARDNVN
jgi:ABC-2 type transport system ATP-binding protein